MFGFLNKVKEEGRIQRAYAQFLSRVWYEVLEPNRGRMSTIMKEVCKDNNVRIGAVLYLLNRPPYYEGDINYPKTMYLFLTRQMTQLTLKELAKHDDMDLSEEV